MHKAMVVFLLVLFLLSGCSSDSAPTPEPDIVLDVWLDDAAREQPIQYIDPVVVHFSEPMDAESTDEPLVIKPTIVGSLSWDDTFTELTFLPDLYFPESGGIFQVKVSSDLTSQSGAQLPSRLSWEIEVEPAVRGISSVNSSVLTFDHPNIIVNFDYVDQESVEEHFQIDPVVAYSLEWSSRRLIITLEEGFKPEEVYTLTLLPGGRRPDGAALKTVSRDFTFEELEVSIERENNHSQLDPFKFTFNYPVDWDTFQDAFVLEPEFEYDLEWRSDRELLLHPAEPLTPGESVTIRVTEDLTSEGGVPLADKEVFYYSSPTLLRDVEGDTDDGYLVYTLDFVIEPDVESVSELIQIEPAIPFETAWDAEDYVFSIRSATRALANEKFTLTIMGEAIDADGFPIDLSVVHPFTTPDLIANIPSEEDLEDYRYRGLNPRDSLTIEFDRPMDPESTQAAISLLPSTDLTFRWANNRELEIIPEPFFPEGLIAEFTIGTDALDQDGNPVLSNPFTWEEEFDYLDDAISFGYSGADVQLVDMDGYRTIDVSYPREFRSQEFETITVEMVRITEQQFTEYLEFVASNTNYDRRKPVFNTSSYGVQAVWEVTEEDLESVFGVEARWGLEVPEHVPDGLYIANLITDHVNDQLAIVASSGSVTAKIGEATNGAGQIVAWVNNINSYMVRDAEVRVFDRNGVMLASGQTNEIGVFEGNYNLDYTPYLVVAKNDRMYTLTGIGWDWKYDYNYWNYWSSFWSTPLIESYLVYTYTDRPIYRPGQTVSYKSIIRLDYDVDYRVPATGKEVAVHLRDARGNLVETQQAWLSPFGSIEGSFLINQGAMLGRYTIQLEIDGEIHEQEFKVQEYSKPDYSVEVSTDSAEYVNGDTVTVQIDSKYLFGEPVINADVTVNLYELALSRYMYWWYEEDIDPDDIEGYNWYETLLDELHGTTDDNGLLTVSFTAPQGRFSNGWYVYDYDYNDKRMYSSRFAVEASIDDGSDQWVSGMTTIEIFSTSADLSLDLNWAAEAGESYPVTANLESIFGMDVAEQTLDLVVEKYERSDSGYWGDYEFFLESELVTDQDGKATTYLDLDSGFYRFVIEGRDDRGNALKTRRYAYVVSEDTDYSVKYIDGVTLSVDRTDYTAGETAEIMIETPIAGEGLLTIERGGVLDYRVVRVEPPFTTIDVPLYADYAPNVFVNFQLWEEIDVMAIMNEWDYYASTAESKLRSDKVEINVADVSHKLRIEVTSDKEVYQPGEEATFYVEVTNYQGEPVNTEVSLALVDEAIYLLSQELFDPIHQAFFSPRDHGVTSYNSLEPNRYLWNPAQGGGGGGERGGGGDFAGEGANPRSDFPDTLVWHPRLITEEDGKVRVTVTLPDSLTTWRVSVKGVTLETEVGEAVHTVVTQQPVVVRPQLPQHVLVGDSFALSAVVHNYTEESLSFIASAVCDICEFTGDTSQMVEIGPGGSEEVTWPVEVTASGEGSIVISAEAGEYGDAVLTRVTSDSPRIVSWVFQSGGFSEEVELTVKVPEGALPGSQLEIKLNRTISSSLLDGVEFLTGFPYGCIEQTMSRALPNAVVSRAFYRLGIDDRGELADLEAKIQASIQRLYALQHDDGGWGWWYDDNTGGYNTAWVVFGLNVIGESGYFIDPGVIERGTASLQENLEGMNPATQAFALYAMSLSGSAELDDVLQLTSGFADLDTFSQSALVLSLHQLGEEELAAELLLSILDDLETDSHGRQYVPGSQTDGYYDRKYMSSEVRSNALLLKAMLTILPEHESIPAVADWLMAKRRSNFGWGSTNETAFTMIALTDYIYQEQTSGEVINYSILLNGAEYADAAIPAGEPAVSVTVPIEELEEGENTVTLKSNTTSRLYYVLGRKVISESLPEDVSGVSVNRKYTNPDTGNVVTSVAEGDLVRVRVTVRVPSDAFYILIEDPLPGGLVALNENLALTSHEVSADPYSEGTRYYWTSLGYNYKEIYPDKVVFFITEMDSGTHIFDYYARAVVSGEFVSMPTHLSAMYDETFFGYWEESILEVVD